MEKPSPSKVPITHPSRELELVGGIKNALERGEPMPKVKKSFLNAGYKQAEVNAAISRLSPQATSQTPILRQQTTPNQKTEQPKEKKPGFFLRLFHRKKSPIQETEKEKPKQIPQKIPLKTQQPTIPLKQPQKKKVSKLWITILIIISALVLIGSAVLGILWDSIF